MRRQPIVLLCALALVLGGCGSGERPAVADAVADAQGTATPFTLSTHCGIHELRTDDGRFWERAEGPLTDGSGNPPPGWDNPSQRGQLVVTDDVAVFTDDRGHRERFVLREGATDFLRLCA